MTNTATQSSKCAPYEGGATADGKSCRTPAFPYPEMPRTVADSGGSTGVQGLSPGTPFFPPGKKGSVYPFSVPLFLEGADHG